jgi:predicted nucleic acid-binding Zn ribbon protein
MTNNEQEFLLQLWERNICPMCGKRIPDGQRVGSGRKSDGGFCSLDCYAEYHKLDLVEKARRATSYLRTNN